MLSRAQSMATSWGTVAPVVVLDWYSPKRAPPAKASVVMPRSSVCSSVPASLSSVALPGREIGYQAAALLDAMMRGQARPAKPILVEPRTVVARGSSDVFAVADANAASCACGVHASADRPLQSPW